MNKEIYTECENWKRRGDELFDEVETLSEGSNCLRMELARHVEIIEKLQERLRDNGINYEVESEN